MIELRSFDNIGRSEISDFVFGKDELHYDNFHKVDKSPFDHITQIKTTSEQLNGININTTFLGKTLNKF